MDKIEPVEPLINVVDLMTEDDVASNNDDKLADRVRNVFKTINKSRKNSKERDQAKKEENEGENKIKERAEHNVNKKRVRGEESKREALDRKYERQERLREKMNRLSREIEVLKLNDESESSDDESEFEGLERRQETLNDLRRAGTLQRAYQEEDLSNATDYKAFGSERDTDVNLPMLKEKAGEYSKVEVRGHKSSKNEFFTALKNNRLLYKIEPTKDNLAGWLSTFWEIISTCWPDLSVRDKIKVCATRFTPAIQSAVNNAEINTKKELFTLASTLYGHGGLNQAKSYRRFFEAVPQSQGSLLEYVNHLETLAECIEIEEEKRVELVLEQIVIHIPITYRHMLKQRGDIEKGKGKKLAVLDILRPIFDDTAAVSEIERFFKTERSRTNQVKEYREEQKVEVKKEDRSSAPMRNDRGRPQGFRHQGFRPQGFRPNNDRFHRESRPGNGPRCARCGLIGHIGNICRKYQREAATPCNWCDKAFRVKNFHFESDCIPKTKRN